jgi:photosystem II stability/assembly factor-like uncharacterized protein
MNGGLSGRADGHGDTHGHDGKCGVIRAGKGLPKGLAGRWNDNVFIAMTTCLPSPAHPTYSLLAAAGMFLGAALAAESNPVWEPIGLSGGGGMFAPAISPADPNLMMINCDMSAAYVSTNGGHDWRMINQAQLRSDTGCRPAFHPTQPDVIYASSGGQLRVSRDRGRTFAPIGNLKESLAGEIAISPGQPELMLAGTSNGRSHVSRDAGRSWTACDGPHGRVLGFHFDRAGDGRGMFAATVEGIWRSDDEGKTWTDKTRGLPNKTIQGFAGGSSADGKLVILYCTVPSREQNGALEGGIYRSRDRGETWESATGRGLNVETKKADEWAYGAIAQYRQVLTSDAKPLTVYAFNTSTGFNPPHHETVFRSDDGGDSWRATYFQDPRFAQFNLEPDYVTAACGQSFKGGETPFGVASCNTNPDRVLLVMNECHITHDGGRIWFNGSTRPAPGEKPGPGSAWIGNGLVVTTTWNYYIDPFEPNRHYIAYTDLGFARSTDAARTWRWWDRKSWAPWRNTCYEIAFDPAVPGLIWGAFSDVHDIPNDNIISERHGHNLPGGVCVSHDFGATWKAEAQGLPARAVTAITIDPRSPKEARTLYAGVFEAGVFKSTDSGQTWVVKKNGLGDPANLRVNRVILHADGTLFAMICAKRAGGGRSFLREGVGLYRSPDGADKWEKINGSQPWLYPKDFAVDPRDSRRLLVGACDTSWEDQSGGLYLTTDGGQQWRRIGRQGPQTFGGYFHPRHADWIYMTLTEGAPGAGLWLSRDNGGTWQAFDDLPFANIQRVTFDPADEQRMFVTTFGGSVWHGPVQPVSR